MNNGCIRGDNFKRICAPTPAGSAPNRYNYAEISGGKTKILAGLEDNRDVNGRNVEMTTKRLYASWPAHWANIFYGKDDCLYTDGGKLMAKI